MRTRRRWIDAFRSEVGKTGWNSRQRSPKADFLGRVPWMDGLHGLADRRCLACDRLEQEYGLGIPTERCRREGPNGVPGTRDRGEEGRSRLSVSFLSVGEGGLNVALRSLDILSICTGGGGLDLGIELAIPGARSVCLVEREAFAVANLVSAMEQGLLHPAPVWSDARTFDGRRWRGCVDGLIGGIPCQPHSLAGKRLGQEDERDLWSDARRILVQSGAWFVLIENVRGILSSGGAERVWRDLRRLGFAVEGGLFTAAEVGASHERERLFILGVADHESGRRRTQSTAGRRDGPARQVGRRGGDVSGVGQADAYGERLEGQRSDTGAVGREDAGRSTGLCDRADLVDAPSIGWREGWSEPVVRSRWDTTTGTGEPVDDASIARGRELSIQQGRQDEAGGDADRAGNLFPPGPGDRENWQAVLERAPHLEPAIRRMADGMAAGMGSRVDELRMLGNGVVPLQAAYAIRTLATRLAGRGSAGATRLVRMMEVVE